MEEASKALKSGLLAGHFFVIKRIQVVGQQLDEVLLEVLRGKWPQVLNPRRQVLLCGGEHCEVLVGIIVK